MSKPSGIIIGAGFTGVATAYDLALRGFDIIVLERGDIANGTSGRTHGLLHSGGRYAVNDQESAIECIDENTILRKIVPQVIEPSGGLFMALTDEEVAYKETFVKGCDACHIPVEELSSSQVIKIEPNINPGVKLAYHVPDGTFDPIRLALAFAASAKKYGAKFRTYHEVEELIVDGKSNVIGVKYLDRTTNTHGELHADIVVNATGAWVGKILENIGIQVPILPTPGVMVAYDQRFCQRVINRLDKPGDGDIILPQRRMMVVGTTSFQTDDLDYVPVIKEQIQLMLQRGAEMVPAVKYAKQRGAYMATRPLIGSGSSGRSAARTFKCFDHKESDNVDGLVTITGGKATTMRQMAEKTSDMVCDKLGVAVSCSTQNLPLVSYRDYYRLQ